MNLWSDGSGCWTHEHSPSDCNTITEAHANTCAVQRDTSAPHTTAATCGNIQSPWYDYEYRPDVYKPSRVIKILHAIAHTVIGSRNSRFTDEAYYKQLFTIAGMAVICGLIASIGTAVTGRMLRRRTRHYGDIRYACTYSCVNA